MSVELRAIIKASKFFYRDLYYKICNVLLGSLVVIIFLLLAIIYVYLSQGVPDFYASSSEGQLTQIPSMATPNYANTPLIQ